MKRRLRKKLHLAEFQSLGFRVEATLKVKATSASDDDSAWWDAMIELVEQRGMACGGGGVLSPTLFQRQRPRLCREGTGEISRCG